MGDEVITNTAPVVGAGPTAGAPATTVATPTPAAAPVAAPSASPASNTAPVSPDTSLLGDVAATTTSPAPSAPVVKEPTTAPVTPATDAPAITEPTPETPVEAVKPTYEAFKLPDGIQVQEEQLSEFTNDLADFELGAKDHASTQEFGQKLLDKHIALVTEAVTNAVKMSTDGNKAAEQAKIAEWKNQTETDPKIGGNRLETTKADAVKFIRMHGGSATEQAEVLQALRDTAAGVHPAIIRLLAQAGKNMSEPRPLAASRPASKPVDKITKRYGNST